MFSYAPEDMPPNAPLVIALHGCTQTSDEYDHGTGFRPSPTGSASRSSIRSSSPPTIRRIVSPGFCPATSRAATARRCRSGRWSSTPLGYCCRPQQSIRHRPLAITFASRCRVTAIDFPLTACNKQEFTRNAKRTEGRKWRRPQSISLTPSGGRELN
jgi:hypothetical protein